MARIKRKTLSSPSGQ